MTWQDGKLTNAKIKLIQGGKKTVAIRYGGISVNIELSPRRSYAQP